MTSLKTVKFSSLALGARFRYTTASVAHKTYVKLCAETIADWDPEQVATTWIGQGIYAASDDDEDFEVVLVP